MLTNCFSVGSFKHRRQLGEFHSISHSDSQRRQPRSRNRGRPGRLSHHPERTRREP